MKKKRSACSFCKRAAFEVRHLVTESKGAAICNECALVTLEVLLEKHEPELAGLLERQYHLIQIDNPVVTIREFELRSEYQITALLVLGFFTTFLGWFDPAIKAESRLDVTSPGIRLSVRSSALHRGKVEEALATYGEILTKRKTPSELLISAAGHKALSELVRAAEENRLADSNERAKPDYTPTQAIGWILSGEIEDHQGLLS